ncbi:hypothetical protein EDB86DRAFT_2833094 [Lactarius hatsudake]|nr:hypothetical protein EDB86DRAFT_2833094 [Lactarius hatsudake]
MSNATDSGDRMTTRGDAKGKMSKVMAIVRSGGIEDLDLPEDGKTAKKSKKSKGVKKSPTGTEDVGTSKNAKTSKNVPVSQLAELEDAFMKKAVDARSSHPRRWTVDSEDSRAKAPDSESENDGVDETAEHNKRHSDARLYAQYAWPQAATPRPVHPQKGTGKESRSKDLAPQVKEKAAVREAVTRVDAETANADETGANTDKIVKASSNSKSAHAVATCPIHKETQKPDKGLLSNYGLEGDSDDNEESDSDGPPPKNRKKKGTKAKLIREQIKSNRKLVTEAQPSLENGGKQTFDIPDTKKNINASVANWHHRLSPPNSPPPNLKKRKVLSVKAGTIVSKVTSKAKSTSANDEVEGMALGGMDDDYDDALEQATAILSPLRAPATAQKNKAIWNTVYAGSTNGSMSKIKHLVEIGGAVHEVSVQRATEWQNAIGATGLSIVGDFMDSTGLDTTEARREAADQLLADERLNVLVAIEARWELSSSARTLSQVMNPSTANNSNQWHKALLVCHFFPRTSSPTVTCKGAKGQNVTLVQCWINFEGSVEVPGYVDDDDFPYAALVLSATSVHRALWLWANGYISKESYDAALSQKKSGILKVLGPDGKCTKTTNFSKEQWEEISNIHICDVWSVEQEKLQVIRGDINKAVDQIRNRKPTKCRASRREVDRTHKQGGNMAVKLFRSASSPEHFSRSRLSLAEPSSSQPEREQSREQFHPSGRVLPPETLMNLKGFTTSLDAVLFYMAELHLNTIQGVTLARALVPLHTAAGLANCQSGPLPSPLLPAHTTSLPDLLLPPPVLPSAQVSPPSNSSPVFSPSPLPSPFVPPSVHSRRRREDGHGGDAKTATAATRPRRRREDGHSGDAKMAMAAMRRQREDNHNGSGIDNDHDSGDAGDGKGSARESYDGDDIRYIVVVTRSTVIQNRSTPDPYPREPSTLVWVALVKVQVSTWAIH